MGHDLECFIDGTFLQPPKFLYPQRTQVILYFTFSQKCNRTIMSWFYSSLKEDKMGEFVGYETDFDIWEALHTVYESCPNVGLRSHFIKSGKMVSVSPNIWLKLRMLLINFLPLVNCYLIEIISIIF